MKKLLTPHFTECPVCGRDITDFHFTVLHDKTRYFVCTADCREEFKKNLPEYVIIA